MKTNLHSNKFPAWLAVILVAIALVTLAMAFSAPKTSAATVQPEVVIVDLVEPVQPVSAFVYTSANNPVEGSIERPEACRTFPLATPFGGVDAINGLPCEAGENIVVEQAEKNDEPVVENDEPVVVETEEPVVVEDDEPVVIDDGGVDMGDDDTHTNNGNHYGNDKPDNNPNDVNNSHNGEQTAADHHDNNGKQK